MRRAMVGAIKRGMHHHGCDEFLAEQGVTPLLHRIDYSGRSFLKLWAPGRANTK